MTMAHELKRRFHLGADLRLWQLALDQAEGHVVPHRHVRPQRVVLEHHADVAVPGRRAGDVLAVHQQLPRAMPVEAGDQPQQRGLAGAGRANQHAPAGRRIPCRRHAATPPRPRPLQPARRCAGD
ncbi:hypothetical protein G6F23_014366 [Rhizopus arrhizus]|nr:hypothetical protein G6F23_014366 [Rhizopus arrhizus]